MVANPNRRRNRRSNMIGGVRLPTHVVYYDEMRYGTRREQVDVRMLEKAGASPVD